LTLLFLLLTFLSLGIMAVLVRLTVTNGFNSLGAHFLEEQAQAVAVTLQGSGQSLALGDSILQTQQGGHFVFVINPDGTYVAHPDPSKVGKNVASDFGADFAKSILMGQGGEGQLADARIVYGYAPIPGRNLTVVAVENFQDLQTPLADIGRITLLQLVASLALTGLVGSLVIWRVVGRPLSKLTSAADQLGRGNLEVNIDPGEMKDELNLLATMLNKMRDQLGSLIRGLQTRIEELADTQYSLRLSEERSRAIFDAVNEAIIVLDYDTAEIIDVNQKMSEMYGYSREEALRLRISSLSSGEIPYSQKYFKKYMKEAVQSGPQLFEWRAKQKDGSSSGLK